MMKEIGVKSLYRQNNKPIKSKKLNYLWAVFLVLSITLLYGLVLLRFWSLPRPLNENDIHNSGEFIASRAQKDLRKLEELGTRVVGSDANEKKAVKLLMDIVDDIKKDASDLYEIENVVQEASGGLVLGPAASFYESIHNVVVRMKPKNSTSRSALLINAHYDTVPTSPGGGDDGLMIAVMLEVLRVISKSKIQLKHSIIFLLNGAEENSLQGSHAFITQHPWAKDIKAFINLDALGNGGREILFQTGPHHPWIAKYYSNHAVHPYASTLGEEFFQLNLIPSDTDFRIFRDFGHIPGLDLAHCLNDYVYHTQYDRMEIIPEGTYQHTGDNILAVTRALANAPELYNTSAYADGSPVFYDILGWFIIYYSENTGIAINMSICLVSITAMILSMAFVRSSTAMKTKDILVKFAIIFVIQAGSSALATGVVMGCSFFLDAIDYSMAWFSQPWLVFGIYFCPYIFIMGIIPSCYLNSNRFNTLPLSYSIQLFLHSHCIMLITVTIALTIFSIRSAFMMTFTIMFYTITLILNWIARLYSRPFIWILPHLIGQIIPFALYGYMTFTSFSMYIPLSGRYGASFNSEMIIAFSSTGFALFMSGFIMPIFSIFRRGKLILSSFLVIFVIFFIFVFTSITFPFTPETAPQRHSVYHTKRIFHSYDGSVRKEDAGYYLLTWDRRAPNTIKDFIGSDVNLLSADRDCKTELLCGLPHYFSGMRKFVSSGYWVEADSPNLSETPALTLLNKEIQSGSRQRFSFRMTGTRQTQIFIEPLAGIKLINWSFPSQLPPGSNLQDDTFFLLMRFGGNSTSKAFTLDFKIPEEHSGPILNIALVGHYQDHQDEHTESFKRFIAKFPPYAALLATESSFESWQF